MRSKLKTKVSLFILAVCFVLFLTAGVLCSSPVRAAFAAEPAAPRTLEELRKADPAEIAALPKYNSRDYGIVTTVKNQGGYNLCWAYGTLAASETSILREGVDNAVQSAFFNLEERNLAWWSHNPRADEFGLISDDVGKGSGDWNKGGYPEIAGKALLQWLGPVGQFGDSEYYAEDDNEQEIRGIHPLKYKLEDLVFISYSVENVKRAVAEYGAVEFSFPIHNLPGGGYTIDTYFNNKNQSRSNPHACAIVGWDDSIPASKYTPDKSDTDGGWIVKNSWGTGYHENGYFYLSYDSYLYDIFAYDYASAKAFDHQYLYDGGLSNYDFVISPSNEGGKAAAIFSAQGGTSGTYEEINAVNIGVSGTDVTANVTVYKGLEPNFGNRLSPMNDPEKGEAVAFGKRTVARKGFYTVYLDTPVPIENGEAFSVVVELSGTNAHFLAELDYSSNDMTFQYKDGKWTNVGERSAYCLHIRAYTKDIGRETAEDPNDLRFARMELDGKKFEYSGSEIEPSVTVTLAGKELVEGRDFDLHYENNLNALGNARAVAVGKGEYTGTCAQPFAVVKAKYPFNLPPTDEAHPIVVGREVTHLGQIPLPEGWRWYYDVDFNVYYDGMLDRVSEWTIEYIGADRENFEITQTGAYVLRESVRHDLISLDGAEAEQKGTCVYTGKAAQPEFTVKLDGTVLVQNVNYTVHTTAVNAGRAVAEIVGIDNYTGTLNAEFTISKAARPPLEGEMNFTLRTGEECLFDVSLPAGWVWEKGDTPLIPGEMRVTCVYSGGDRANFEELTREIILTVVRASEPEPDPDPQPELDPDPQPEPDRSEEGGTTGEENGGEKGDGREETAAKRGCASSAYVLPAFLLVGFAFLRRRRR